MRSARVRLLKPRRVLTFLCGDEFALQRDEACIVQSDRGLEWGVCVLPPEPCPPEIEERHSMRVLRKATANDFKTQERMPEEERRALEVCAKKIEKRGLPMKLVDAEYTFDKRKVVFYFTADHRVDFRELVRDLAHELRTRIELRHIQVRDEAKILGGLGSCGRSLCCSMWLDEFKPISMRMAKRQNLALNPAKISGQCGRLLCCLSYENDMYPSGKKKRKPQPEAEEQAEAEEKPQEAAAAPEPTPEQPQPEPPAADGEEAAPAQEQGEAAQESQEDQKPRGRGKRRRPRRRKSKKGRGGGGH